MPLLGNTLREGYREARQVAATRNDRPPRVFQTDESHPHGAAARRFHRS